MPTQEDFDNCELENDNLRKLLAWAAERLPEGDKPTLAERLEATFAEGGVTEDGREDEREEYRKVVALLAKLAAHLEAAVEHKGEPPNAWYAKADALASEANGYQPPSLEATLHEARNLKS